MKINWNAVTCANDVNRWFFAAYYREADMTDRFTTWNQITGTTTAA